MYILIVSYTKSNEQVALHADTHSAWVKKYFDKGVFILAGPKKTKLGGAILAKSIPRDLLEDILAEDSYIQAGVAEYNVIDFDCKVVASGLDQLVLT